jgi:ankyrin repeat protein
MKRSHLKRILIACVMLTLGFGMVSFWVHRQRRQQLMDHQLMDAIWAADTNRALDLLEQGADANAGEISTKLPSFWQKVNNVLRGHHLETSTGTTALMVNFIFNSPYTTPWRLIPLVTQRRDTLTRALLRHGAHINARDENGCTALFWAVEHADGNTVSLLLRCGADPTLADDYGNTPLHRAAWNGHLAMLRAILQCNVDVNRQRNDGETALMQAADMQRNPEYFQELLRHGADVHLKDNRGRTASDYARRNNNPAAARLLMLVDARK